MCVVLLFLVFCIVAALEFQQYLGLRCQSNIGALIIRIGFGGILYYSSNKDPPPNPILVINAPTLDAHWT